ncbi:MAG TPA: TIGR02466 family protein [Sphingomicrobium sp.]|nr:TIGR02466 family protein [Sphingomicrobium sp.]
MTDAPASRRRRLRLFATPVIIDELADSAELNTSLEGAILERMRSDPGLRLSNFGGWQSNHDLTAWSGDAGQRVIRHAAALATSNTAAQGKAGMSWSIDAWANVSASGASNRSHIHGGSYWSAVYYVAVGEGEGGELMLHDPRMPALRMHAPNLRFKDGGPEVVASIKPKAGMMILFPAWLSHSVQPWVGGESRISIAMNIRVGSAAPRRGLPAPTPRPNPNKDN